jgi:hypothetical protein
MQKVEGRRTSTLKEEGGMEKAIGGGPPSSL